MSNTQVVKHKATTKSILDLHNLYDRGNLNLEPGFQRQSVWKDRDRDRLIDSILQNYPLPAIFLYRRDNGGHLVFDVIDGKQRLESIFMFTGAKRGRFDVRTQLPGTETLETVDWRLIKKRKLQNLILGYEIPVIEVDGEIGEIVDLFIRINSTGKALTAQEKRHARYYNSPILKEAARLAKRSQKYFLSQGIFNTGQLSRMQHIEFACELMLSLMQGDVLNKKTALDKVMATSTFDGRQLKKMSRIVTTTLNRIKRMFPEVNSTRFRKVTDFYSLAVLIGKYELEGLILTDRRRNRLAWDLLLAFSVKVDEVSENMRRGKGVSQGQEMYREYLHTVLQATDEVVQRRKREQFLDGILRSVFERKDTQRGFTSEQRRIMWNTAQTRTCSHPGCTAKLTWDDFTIDHINPHSKGGRSQLENAALMCRKHNSKKGNRRK